MADETVVEEPTPAVEAPLPVYDDHGSWNAAMRGHQTSPGYTYIVPLAR